MMNYIKKLIPVQAIQFTGKNYDEVNLFVKSKNLCQDIFQGEDDYVEERNMVLMTKRGEQIIELGDFIIKESTGENIVCSEKFFHKHYTIQDQIENIDDGYHTFKELYDYRMLYNAAFFNLLAEQGKIPVCKSLRHHSGEECFGGGWFIVMAELPTGQISNHYETKYWDLFNIPEKETGFEFDGHTSNDVENRLREYLKCNMGSGKTIENL